MNEKGRMNRDDTACDADAGALRQPVDRRRVIGSIGVGGAIAGASWVAPSVLTTSIAAAGSGGGGGGWGGGPINNYVISTIPFSPPVLGSPTVLSLAGDDNTQSLPDGTIPFPFGFYALSGLTGFWVSTNGVLGFAPPANASWGNSSLASAGIDNAVFPYWDDLLPGTVQYETLGSSPNRTFVVQWANFNYFANYISNTLTFTVVLHEGSFLIDLYYNNTTDGGTQSAGGSATVGVRGTLTSFTQHSFNQQLVPTGTALRFTPL